MLTAPSGGFFTGRTVQFSILYVTERIVKEDNLPFDIGQREIPAQFQQEDRDLVPDEEIGASPSSHMPSLVVAEQRPVRFRIRG